MRVCKEFNCWTDYPVEELGDAPNQLAPIRHVQVLAYDQNKYVMVKFINENIITSFKAGYLYRHKGRYGQVKQVNYKKIQRMKGEKTYFEYMEAKP